MKKILVIEDERSIRESILELLDVEGFQVLGAQHGAEGVQLALQSLPDLILCDVMMPQLDGYGVLTELRAHPATAAIPFIFLTAKGSTADFRQGMNLGADDFLTKPCTSKELLAAIDSRFAKQAAIQNRSQKQLEELRNSIALSLPHELRTPLNGILGLTEVLIADYDRIDRSEILEVAQGIHSSAERLYRLIQNFLLYVELEMTAQDDDRIQTLRHNETRFPHIIITNTAKQMAQQAGRASDLQLDLQTAPIQISDVKLKKVIEELTSNAFKFSSPGTLVTVTATVTDTELTIAIADQGRGMTTEQITQLGAYMQFERKFYEQQGSGLGFTIAKRIVELHGGTVTIASIPGKQTVIQTTFLVKDGEPPLSLEVG